jgi:DNA repair protein RadA/Sms
MQKQYILFECTSCGGQSQKWSGRCLGCGTWGTLQKTLGTDIQKKQRETATPSAHALPFSEIGVQDFPLVRTGMAEVDQVLGGGIVPGSLLLIGGEPGIGKSTLLLQIAHTLANSKKNVLYCSGEESGHQVKRRLERLDTQSLLSDALLFASETDADKICATIREKKPFLAIIDSIQTIHTTNVPSEAGSVAQVRACTVKLLEMAKTTHTTIIIVGHVTKEGMVAGPKTLEHLVDTVLYLEGDQSQCFRLLKTVKNRFGSTNEIGVFEMTGSGLEEVQNPSAAFLSQESSHMPGTALTAVLEGSRAFLAEVQALSSKTYFGYPQRRTVGFDANRLQLLIAVLTKRIGVNLGDQDIHLNIVGGFKISEPAVDLAVCASILSAYKNKPLENGSLFVGEVGLAGEIRPVSHIEKRLKEAEKLGITTAYIPKTDKKIESILRIIPIKHVKELEI